MNKNTSPKGLSKPQALILARVQAHPPVAGLAGGLFVSGHEFRTAASLEKRGLLTLTPYGDNTGWAVAVAEKKPIVKGHPASPVSHEALIALDKKFGTDPNSPLHHNNRECACKEA